MIPDLRNCRTSPAAGCSQRVRRGARRRGQAAQPPAGGHRADEDVLVARVDDDPRAIAQQRATRALGGRVDGEHGDAAAARAPGRDEVRQQRRLAGARGTGDADDVGRRLAPERGRGDGVQQRVDLSALCGRPVLDEVEHRGRGGAIAVAQAPAEVFAGGGHLPADASTPCRWRGGPVTAQNSGGGFET
jgi:hypothetical protein